MPRAMPRRPHTTISLRLDPELHRRLSVAVARERRSITAQLTYLAEQWLERVEREERERQQREGPPPA